MIRIFPSELKGIVDDRTYKRLLEIYGLIYSISDRLDQTPATTTLTAAQLQQIKAALQARGPAQLNVQGLLGVLAQAQVAGAPAFDSFPVPADPRSQDGALGVLAGTPNVLYRYDQVSRTWVAVGAMGLLKIDHGGVLVGTRPELNFVDSDVVWTIADDSVNNRINLQGAVQAYKTVEDEGTPLTQRSTVNFVGAGVTATDAGGKTVVTIPGGVSSIPARAIGITIDGAGSAITTGIKGDIYVPYACTITAVTMLADQSGSIVVDIWKDVFANYPPTVADTIIDTGAGGTKPTISSATNSQDNTLAHWTTSVSAGDTIRFNVDSCTSITRCTLVLTVTV